MYGPDDFQLTAIQTCGERINQLRRQMMLHSYLYYELGENRITDHEFDRRAYELVDLQTKHPDISEAVPYELSAFRDFDASTGMHLPFRNNGQVATVAYQLKVTDKLNQRPIFRAAPDKEILKVGGIELYPHQQRAVEQLSNGKVLVGGVGTGKTITSLVYYYTKVMGGELNKPQTIQTPMDIYVFTTARKRDELDWQRDAAKMSVSRDREASIHGITITVDSYNNIKKYAKVEGAFIILDEQRMVGSGAWTKAFISLAKKNQWIMLSATPGDKWEDYIPLFIANGFVKNRTEFKRNHVVYSAYSKFPKVERYLETGKLLKWRHQILVDMPYERHTTRHIHSIPVRHNVELMKIVQEKRWNPFEDRPLRDSAEMFATMRRVAYQHSDRRDTVIDLLKNSHQRLIVFYNYNFELEALRTIADDLSDWKVAEWNGHKHEEVPTGEKWLYLVQYVAGAEAWNCVETDAICFYSQTYSYKNFEQAQGRIDRLNTPFDRLHYYVLTSSSDIDRAVGRALKNKKSFNEAEYNLWMS